MSLRLFTVNMACAFGVKCEWMNFCVYYFYYLCVLIKQCIVQFMNIHSYCEVCHTSTDKNQLTGVKLIEKLFSYCFALM